MTKGKANAARSSKLGVPTRAGDTGTAEVLPSNHELIAYDVTLNGSGSLAMIPLSTTSITVRGNRSPSNATVTVRLEAEGKSVTHSGADVDTSTAGQWSTTFFNSEWSTWGLVAPAPAKIVVIVSHAGFGDDATGTAYQGRSIRKFIFT